MRTTVTIEDTLYEQALELARCLIDCGALRVQLIGQFVRLAVVVEVVVVVDVVVALDAHDLVGCDLLETDAQRLARDRADLDRKSVV